MNIVALNDTHIRGTKPVARLETQEGWEHTVFTKLAYVIEYANYKGAVICHAGDVFDTPKDFKGLSLFAKAMTRGGEQTLYAVTGQHDLYMRNREALTNYRLLEDLGFIKDVREPVVLHDQITENELTIYGAGWGDDIPTPKKEHHGTKYNLLLIHAPISTRPLYPGHEYTGAKQFAKKWSKHYDIIICGDCHVPFYEHVNGCHLVNSGPLLRLDAGEDNMGHTPGFFTISIEGTIQVDWVTVPHEQAQQVLTRDHLERKETAQAKMDQFVAAMKQENKMDAIDIADEVRKVAKDISTGAQRILGLVMEEADEQRG